MKAVTVKRLLELCKMEVAKGNGDKEILLSNDDEGNNFHHCFYEFTEDVADNCDIKDPEKYIILG